MSVPARYLLAGAFLFLISPDPAHAQRGQVTLPEGPGREVVQTRCGACHGLNQITGSAGYSREAWHDLIGTMIALPPQQLAEATTYLAANFPEKAERRPKLVPGDVKITFKEWTVPTLGQRARDPIQLKDGKIWWTGMYASLVGRLDPATGEMKEFPLPKDARPHGITSDPAGNIWYTGNGNGTVGKLNAETGEVTTYQMPLANARDPHTAIFDQKGTMFFTLQQSNMIGRLIPGTGEVTLVTSPTERAAPYGIKVDSKGTPWIAYNGSNKVASLNPVTLEIREYAMPNPATRIRRLALGSDDVIYYVDSARGYVGRFDPKTGEQKDWPSPSGPTSHPYAIAVVNDVVWYNESGMRPDTLVRFDPKTEKFQSWAIPSGYGIIRHMTVSPEGNLVFHQSSSNKVGLVILNEHAGH